MSERAQRRVSSREGYARWAETYDDFDNPMTAMVAHALAWSPQRLDGFDAVELGCGTGRNAKLLRGLGMTRYLGLDDSGEMLRVGRQKGSVANVELREHDVTLPWTGSAGFDVALISLVLEHFRAVGPVLECAAGLVRPEGELWLFELHPWLHERSLGAHVDTADETWMLPSYPHAAEELAGVLLAAGWEVFRVTDWYATELAARSCRKLQRYLGNPVLLEIRARRAP
jgi:SAM-dependent methyltransferase